MYVVKNQLNFPILFEIVPLLQLAVVGIID